MAFGLDFAWGHLDISAAKAANVKFVCRYVSTPGNSKNISKSEYRLLNQAGLHVVIVFETTAARMLRGAAAGHLDAVSAQQQIVLAGLPSNTPIYFACDFDATPAQQIPINAYLQAAANVIGHNRTGIYAGYWAVKRALDERACKYAWQTYAWSGGHWDPRAHIQQYSNGHHLAGVSCDYNRNIKEDFGQVPRPAAPVPVPIPHPSGPPSPHGNTLPHIHLRDKNGKERWEPLTRRNILLRSGQLIRGKYAEIDFIRKPKVSK